MRFGIIYTFFLFFYFFNPCTIFCQFSPLGCTDNTGDVIVNQDFGSGFNYGPALGAGQTNLIYFANDCPIDGYYCITNITTNCFGNNWHTLTDHTGNTNGYFMLVNASYTPSDFYIQKVNGLCEASTYFFSAWIANVIKTAGISPNVTMTIEETNGTILASYNTGDIAISNPPQWKQYKMYFTTPPGITNVVLRMYNSAPGGNGNDLGLDDITFSPAGPLVSAIATVNGNMAINICRDDVLPVTLKGNVASCYTQPAYQWQISQDNKVSWSDIANAQEDSILIIPKDTGVHFYRLVVAEKVNIANTQCRVVSNVVTMYVYPDSSEITISASKTNICEGEAINFKASGTNGGNNPTYNWYINNNITGANNTNFSSSLIQNGDTVKCILQSSIPCNLRPAISNKIVIKVNKKTSSTIDKSICEGDSFEGYTTNGTYTDLFTGSNGCDSLRTINLTVNQKKQSFFDTTICEGNQYAGFKEAGIYTQTFVNSTGCDSLHTITLYINPLPKPFLGYDTVICANDEFTISPGIFDNYLWQDGSIFSSYKVTKGGLFSVLVKNNCGEKQASINVTDTICDLFFPTAITPNGDGLNDCFRVLNAFKITNFHLEIFNRWGQRVFETTNPSACWSGSNLNSIENKKQQGGSTFIWICTINNIKNPLKGTVTIMN